MAGIDGTEGIVDQAFVETGGNRLLITLMTPPAFGANQQFAESPGQGMIHRLE
jgi:hypothetical protein